MKLYIAGPMRGYPEFNFPEFHRVAADLRARGFEVISPAEMESSLGVSYEEGNSIPYMREAMRRDTDAICDCDGVYLMFGWQQSRGACAEKALADAIGLKVLYEAIDVAPHRYTPEKLTCK